MTFQSTLPRGSDHKQAERHRYEKISIHAPSRERPKAITAAISADSISIHAPSRERPCNPDSEPKRKAISIHAPSRERPRAFLRPRQGACISIHAPSRERLLLLVLFLVISAFQSTLPRGSDSKITLSINLILISIHAPSRERPLQARIRGNNAKISIHAPSRERL